MVVLAFFLASGLNMCLLFLPAQVLAAEEAVAQKSTSMPCHGKKIGQMEMVHEKMAHKKSQANNINLSKTENKKSNTVLPCCENHDKGTKVNVPREEISFDQIQCPMTIDFNFTPPQIVINTSDILVVDLPPPEAGLISSTIKRE